MNPAQVRHAAEKIARGEHLGPTELRLLSEAAMVGSLTIQLSDRPTPLQPSLQHLRTIAAQHLQGLTYA